MFIASSFVLYFTLSEFFIKILHFTFLKYSVCSFKKIIFLFLLNMNAKYALWNIKNQNLNSSERDCWRNFKWSSIKKVAYWFTMILFFKWFGLVCTLNCRISTQVDFTCAQFRTVASISAQRNSDCKPYVNCTVGKGALELGLASTETEDEEIEGSNIWSELKINQQVSHISNIFWFFIKSRSNYLG